MTRLQSSPQQQTAEPQSRETDPEFARLMSKNARIGRLYTSLAGSNHNIEAMLPDFMKGQADRLIRRACITFSKNADLQGITDEDYRRCVIEAAEMGFAIDGRLCYVVKYKNTYQLQLDYKAVVAVAKRNRTIKDIDADVVCENDRFRHGKFGGDSVLEHTFDLSEPRGEVIGAYCRVYLPDGTWNYEVMTRSQLDAVQRRAPAQNGPWKTDPDEMRKKTVIRRKLKLYQDDPGLMRMLEITSWEDEGEDDNRPRTVAELGKRLTTPRASAPPPNAGYSEPPAAGEIPPETYDRPDATDDLDDTAVSHARESFMVAQDEQGVDFELDACKSLGLSAATMAAIEGLAADRKSAIRNPPAKGKSQKQLAGT